jgi:hypothetical protein
MMWEFKSLRPHQVNMRGSGSVVERRLAKADVAGPNPVSRSICAPLAQLVEHLTLNQGVPGSSPRWRTRIIPPSLRTAEFLYRSNGAFSALRPFSRQQPKGYCLSFGRLLRISDQSNDAKRNG